MIGIGTTDLFTGHKAPNQTADVLPAQGFQPVGASGDVLVVGLDGTHLSVGPDGSMGFGTTADGAWQRFRVDGNLLVARTGDGSDPQPLRAFLLAKQAPNA